MGQDLKSMREEDLRLLLAWVCGLIGIKASAEELKTLPDAFQQRVIDRATLFGLTLENTQGVQYGR